MGQGAQGEDASATGGREAFCSGMLFECLTKGAPEMVIPYLGIWHACTALAGGEEGGLEMRRLRLLLDYYATPAPRLLGGADAPPLVQAEFLASVSARLEASFAAAGTQLDAAFQQYLARGALPEDSLLRARFAAMLAFHAVPPRADLERLRQHIATAAPASHAGWLLAARRALPRTPTQTLMRLATAYATAAGGTGAGPGGGGGTGGRGTPGALRPGS